jgi:hypothetical protein
LFGLSFFLKDRISPRPSPPPPPPCGHVLIQFLCWVSIIRKLKKKKSA